MKKAISQATHIEWSKHPELLVEIGELREREIPFPEIADLFKTKHDINVHSDTIRSAYKRHKEMIRRELKLDRSVRHAGVVRVTKEVLEGIFNLPEGIAIQHLEYDHMRGIAEFLLIDNKGKRLPENHEGTSPLCVTLEEVGGSINI